MRGFAEVSASRDPRAAWARFGLLLSLVLLALHAWYFRVFLDDAYISFRYARNFADGLGLVYNAGERVEGYTNFLWVVLLGGLRKLGFDIEASAQVLGLLFSAGTLVLLYRFPIAGGSGRAAKWERSIPSLFLAASLAFAFQCFSGLATPLYIFLLTAALLLSERETRKARGVVLLGIVLALLAMTRPEGVMVFGLVLLWESLDAHRSRELRRAALLFVTFLLVYGSYFAWRYGYYGFLLPNTFYAKVGSSADQVLRGLAYLRAFLPVVAGPLLFLAAAGALDRDLLRSQARRLMLIGVYSGYVVLVGGDHMPVHRFLVPLLPIFFLVMRDAFVSLRTTSGQRRPAVFVALALALLHVGHFSARKDLGNVFHETLEEKRAQERELRLTGEYFKAHAPPGASIALGVIGAVGYFSELHVIDFFGLTDVHIAHREVGEMGRGVAGHERGDGRYILSLEPDFVLNTYARLRELPLAAEPPARQAGLFWTSSEREMARSDGFWRNYRMRSVELEGRFLNYYERRSPEQNGPG